MIASPRMRAELKAAAVEAGILDQETLNLVDLSQGGDAAKLIRDLKTAKPHLFSVVPSAKPGPAQKRAIDMTDAEYRTEKAKLIRGVPVGMTSAERADLESRRADGPKDARQMSAEEFKAAKRKAARDSYR